MYYLQSTERQSLRLTACSFAQCRADYYCCIRSGDGSIPWRMMYQDQMGRLCELVPNTGDIIKQMGA